MSFNSKCRKKALGKNIIKIITNSEKNKSKKLLENQFMQNSTIKKKVRYLQIKNIKIKNALDLVCLLSLFEKNNGIKNQKKNYKTRSTNKDFNFCFVWLDCHVQYFLDFKIII